MALSDLLYESIRSVVLQGVSVLDVPWFTDEDLYTPVGMFLAFGERFKTWENGGSIDPAFFSVYSELYSDYFAERVPDAENTFAFARLYLQTYENQIIPGSSPLENGALLCFDAGVSLETWTEQFNELSHGVVE